MPSELLLEAGNPWVGNSQASPWLAESSYASAGIIRINP